MARQGKIARLPARLREQVNRRLHDGQTAGEILAWLNQRPEARAVVDSHFAGEPVSEQNLSAWRGGGYLDWLRQREREDSLRQLADYSHRLAEAGGTSLARGAANIAAGHILEVLETIADGTVKITPNADGPDLIETGPDAGEVIKALARLRKLEIDADKLALVAAKEEREKERLQLDREKFQALAVEKFLQWAKSDAARKILDDGQPRHVQAAKLRELMFGSE